MDRWTWTRTCLRATLPERSRTLKTFPFDGERVLLARLDRGDDLLASLQALCETERVEAGVIQAIGAVERAVVGFYDQADGSCVGAT